MWDLIVSVPDHCLSFYFDSDESTFFICFEATPHRYCLSEY